MKSSSQVIKLELLDSQFI
jgi:hypothetical protein